MLAPVTMVSCSLFVSFYCPYYEALAAYKRWIISKPTIAHSYSATFHISKKGFFSVKDDIFIVHGLKV